MSTFILVHGAYHGAWCYSKLVPFLKDAGHAVIALDLPGHGNNPRPIHQITLSNYVKHVCEIIDLQSDPVILVGHSLGGVTISQTAENRSNKIKYLVYLTAMMPKNGESRMDISARVNEIPKVAEARVSIMGGEASIIRDDSINPLFYGDCLEEDISFAKKNLVPQATQILHTKVNLSNKSYGTVPRVFIECHMDEAIPLQMQRRMIADMPCERVLSLNTSHSPFFSAPNELAVHLLSLS